MEDRNSDNFRDPDEYLDLASSLRHGPGSEFLEEARLTEIETELGRRRGWGLRDVWERAMHRGDRIVAAAGGLRVVGTVDFVGDDFATVTADGRCWEVRLSSAVLRTTSPGRAGHTVSGGSRTLKARLSEFAATGEAVTVLGDELDVSGVVRVVATDHLVLDDVTVPLDLVTVVRR